MISHDQMPESCIKTKWGWKSEGLDENLIGTGFMAIIPGKEDLFYNELQRLGWKIYDCRPPVLINELGPGESIRVAITHEKA